MKLRDCAIKVAGDEIWLHDLTSSYRVRLNEEALGVLERLLKRTGDDGLDESEAHIFERLHRRGLLDPIAGPTDVPIRRGSPLQVLDLELSSRCNLRCAHCFAAMDARSMMGPTVLERIFAGVSDLEPVSLVLNGGEPLLNPHWRDVVQQARARDLRVVVMTNGTLVTPDIAGFLAAERVAKVIISLDGFSETHEALRGARTYDRTIAGIRCLVAVGVPVFVTTMVSPELLARRSEFERFCLEELGVASVRYASVMPIGQGATAPDRFKIEAEVLADLHRAGDLREDHDASAPRYAGRAWPCGAGVEQCFIAADGRVYECHYFQNLEETMGDLATASLADIYRASLAGQVTERTHWKDLDGCRDCPALEACHGGCRARAKLLKGSYSAPDPYCCSIHRSGA